MSLRLNAADQRLVEKFICEYEPEELYEVNRVLGQGAYGTVFLVRDITDGAFAALKVID